MGSKNQPPGKNTGTPKIRKKNPPKSLFSSSTKTYPPRGVFYCQLRGSGSRPVGFEAAAAAAAGRWRGERGGHVRAREGGGKKGHVLGLGQ